MTILTFVLVWAHFLGDFVAQSDSVAKGKSTSNFLLLSHVCFYGTSLLIPLVVLLGVVLAPTIIARYVAVNVVLHFVTDYFTSRLSAKLWATGRRHDFFVVIGFDQAMHLTTLFATTALLGGVR